mmetsp:Transcript_52811/g.113083  ORF Transcript_52811/g.113083 Transcript_52811/m.113083 type:complete len:575 (-) Transcript_52811:64-1788(-)
MEGTFERRRLEAEERVTVLEAELASLNQVSQEQQDAIEELHNAWLCVQTSRGAVRSGGSGVEEASANAAAAQETTETQAAELQRLRAKVEEMRVLVLNATSAPDPAQSDRIAELEKERSQHNLQIMELRASMQEGEEKAKSARLVLEAEKRSLALRAEEAEAKLVQLSKMLEDEKVAATRAMASQRATSQDDELLTKSASATTPRARRLTSTETSSTSVQFMDDVEGQQKLGGDSEMWGRKLPQHELRALHQRIAAAESRAGVAEAKQRGMEELLSVRLATPRESQAIEASSESSTQLTRLQAENGTLRKQLMWQKQSFEKEVYGFTSKLTQCQEVLMSARSADEAVQKLKMPESDALLNIVRLSSPLRGDPHRTPPTATTARVQVPHGGDEELHMCRTAPLLQTASPAAQGASWGPPSPVLHTASPLRARPSIRGPPPHSARAMTPPLTARAVPTSQSGSPVRARSPVHIEILRAQPPPQGQSKAPTATVTMTPLASPYMCGHRELLSAGATAAAAGLPSAATFCGRARRSSAPVLPGCAPTTVAVVGAVPMPGPIACAVSKGPERLPGSTNI